MIQSIKIQLLKDKDNLQVVNPTLKLFLAFITSIFESHLFRHFFLVEEQLAASLGILINYCQDDS